MDDEVFLTGPELRYLFDNLFPEKTPQIEKIQAWKSLSKDERESLRRMAKTEAHLPKMMTAGDFERVMVVFGEDANSYRKFVAEWSELCEYDRRELVKLAWATSPSN